MKSFRKNENIDELPNPAYTDIGSLKFESEWLTTKEAATILRITEQALRNMTSNGKVPYYKLGRRNRYRRVDLENLLLSEKRGVDNGN